MLNKFEYYKLHKLLQKLNVVKRCYIRTHDSITAKMPILHNPKISSNQFCKPQLPIFLSKDYFLQCVGKKGNLSYMQWQRSSINLTNRGEFYPPWFKILLHV